MKEPFRWRVFISFGLLLSFLVLLVSGVILYVAPPGRVANWTDWRMIGLTKGDWQHQHTVFALSFVLLSILHLFLINWKLFLSYLKRRASGGRKQPIELSAVIVLGLLLWLGTHFNVQPLSAVVGLGSRISDSWEDTKSGPPVPHLERMTLAEIAQRTGLEGLPDVWKSRLEEAGISVPADDQTLAEVASSNRMSPDTLFRIMAPEHGEKPLLPTAGLGQMTLEQLCEEVGVPLPLMKVALAQEQIEADPDARLRTVAEQNRLSMSDLREILEETVRALRRAD